MHLVNDDLAAAAGMPNLKTALLAGKKMGGLRINRR